MDINPRFAGARPTEYFLLDGEQSQAAGGIQRRKASTWERCIPLLTSSFSIALIAALAALRWSHFTSGSRSAIFALATEHRVTVQVVVNILASVLAFLQTYSMARAYNLAMRPFLAGRQISIYALRLYVSISRAAFERNLPLRLLLVSALVFGVALLPQWLWTGALTPQIVTRMQTGNVPLVKTGPGSYPFLDYIDGPISAGCWRQTQANGTFTNCPGREYSGSIIHDMSIATGAGNVPRNHTKLDNSGYSYVGRSYGVGSAVGLHTLPDFGVIHSYNFSETGYDVDASCRYNHSSDFTLGGKFTDEPIGTPNAFLANGSLPNQQNATAYVLLNLGDYPDQVVAMAAGSYSCCNEPWANGTGPFSVAITAGEGYDVLNQVQCELSFQPTRYDVQVYNSSRAIQVTPQTNTTEVPDPEPRGFLREWTLRGLQSLPMIETTLYVSSLGEAFVNNIVNVMNDPSVNITDLTSSAHEDALPAIEDSLKAAMDDMLASISESALTQANGSWQYAAADFEVAVVQIGSLQYLIALLCVNLVGFLGILGAAVYTRFFSNSPAFDFADLGSLIAAEKNGAARVDSKLATTDLKSWRGDAAEPSLGRTRLVLDCNLGSSGAPSAVVR